MEGNKQWYLSRTVWAGLVTVGLSIAGLLGYGTELVDQGALVEVLLQLATTIAGIFSLF